MTKPGTDDEMASGGSLVSTRKALRDQERGRSWKKFLEQPSLRAQWEEATMSSGCYDRLRFSVPFQSHSTTCVGVATPSKCLCPCHDDVNRVSGRVEEQGAQQ